MGWVRENEIVRELSEISRSLRKMERSLADLVDAVGDNPNKGSFHYTVGPTTPKEIRKMPLTVTSTNEEKVKITATPVTSTGRPAELDDAIRVSVISGDSTVELIDELSFYVISSDTPGDTSYLVEADADLGDGVVLVQDTITYTVAGALAANLGLVAGAPEPK